MLYATAGSRLYVGGPSSGAPSWTEIRGLTALGQLGTEWRTTEVLVCDGEDNWSIETSKEARAAQPMVFLFAVDPDDAGQEQLWTAVEDWRDYWFRLVLPSEEARTWAGPVLACVEVLDEANSVMQGQATVALNSSIERGGA